MTRACHGLWVSIVLVGTAAHAADSEPWQQVLARMPLAQPVRQLNQSNCVQLMMRSFQSNQVVKALVFMPGATDEFYMFHRATAKLPNDVPTMLDAVHALTSQTWIRATFHHPPLLLHTDEDPIEPLIKVEDESMVAKLKQSPFLAYLSCHDRDWAFLQPVLKKNLKTRVLPARYSYDTWHFYRHSFVAWNLTRWEALETVALAGKTRITVQRGRLLFEGDERVRATPRVDPTR